MLIGISGKKQSGKSTLASYLMGEYLIHKNLIEKFTINNETSELSLDKEVYDSPVHIYSFVTQLKNMAIKVFGLTPAQVYGSDDMKNSMTKYRWENMPLYKNKDLNGKMLLKHDKVGQMTAREFLEVLGTDICRTMYDNVWVEATLREVMEDARELAIINDCRFPNEVEAIKNAGGIVIRLTRKPFESTAKAEVALDEYKFDYIINNENMSIMDKNFEAYQLLKPAFEACSLESY